MAIHAIKFPSHFNTYLFFAILIAREWGFTPYALIFLMITGPFPELLGGNTKIGDYILLIWTTILTYLATITSMDILLFGMIAAVLEQFVNGVLQFILSDNPIDFIIDPAGQVFFNYVLFTRLTDMIISIMTHT